MPQLRYLDSTGLLSTVTMGAQPILIGRSNTCNVVFIDDMISREHTRIDRDPDGKYRLRDLGSRNKTHVNGQQVNETLLIPGDIIRVGDHVLEYLDNDAGSERISADFLTPDTQDPADCSWVKIKAPITLASGQLERLSGLFNQSGLTSRPEDIAHLCLSRIVVELQAERGFIAVRGDDKHVLNPIAVRGLARGLSGSMTPVSHTFAVAPLLQKVAGSYPQSSRKVEDKAGYATVAAVAPLMFQGTPVGVIYIDRPTSKQPFSAATVQHLIAAGAMIGAAMGAATRRLSDTIGMQESAWLSSVRQSHVALNSAPVGNDTFDVGYRLFPGGSCRGDFCDVFHLDDQRCLVLMVDASGQGHVGIAQAMAIRGAMLNAAGVHADEIDLAATFNALNSVIANQHSRQLVACTAMICDLPAGRMTYLNAGFPPPIVMVGPGRQITLDQPSLLLGIDREYLYEETSVEMPRDFRLVVCSNGLCNTVNGSNEVFGDRRLNEFLLEKESFGTAEHIVKLISDSFTTHIAGNVQESDATALVVGRS